MSEAADEYGNIQRDYVVVLRTPTAIRYMPDGFLRVDEFPSAVGPVTVIFRTRYVDEGYSVPVPRDLWVDVRGAAPSLQVAIEAFASAAESIVPILTLSANACAGEIMVELAYDNTSGINRREYFQQFLPEERGMPRMGRRINIPATLALIKALASHKDNERIHRAISQYHQALLNWNLGRETLALAHLYMGMEALTKVAVRKCCQDKRLTEQELAASMNIQIKELDSTIRRSNLFQGDSECHKQAKAASDGFEHGFASLKEVRSLASGVRDRTAGYLRAAILDLLGIERGHHSILSGPPFDTPAGSWPYARYLKGYLIGDTDDLVSENQEYPIARWEWSIKSFSQLDSGEYNMEVNSNITPILGDGVAFEPHSVEVWGPQKNQEPAAGE